MMQRPLLAFLNHLLRQDSWAQQRLHPFAGRTARITLPPFLTLNLAVAEDGTLCNQGNRPPDVVIRLPQATPWQMLAQPQEALAAARLEGSADFAEALAFVFRHLRWDVEADLARVVGDIPARRITDLGQRFGAWQRQAAGRVAQNLSEFVAQEQGSLARHGDMERQRDGVEQTRHWANELEARLQRLEQQPR